MFDLSKDDSVLDINKPVHASMLLQSYCIRGTHYTDSLNELRDSR